MQVMCYVGEQLVFVCDVGGLFERLKSVQILPFSLLELEPLPYTSVTLMAQNFSHVHLLVGLRFSSLQKQVCRFLQQLPGTSFVYPDRIAFLIFLSTVVKPGSGGIFPGPDPIV